jgi:hypothetical protein
MQLHTNTHSTYNRVPFYHVLYRDCAFCSMENEEKRKKHVRGERRSRYQERSVFIITLCQIERFGHT